MTQRDSSRELAELGAWVEQYGDVLYRYALARVKDRHVAEDLVQETFLAVLEKYDEFQGRSKATTWLIGILRNKVGSFWRKSGRERPESELADDPDFRLAFFDQRGHWKRGISAISAQPAGRDRTQGAASHLFAMSLAATRDFGGDVFAERAGWS